MLNDPREFGCDVQADLSPLAQFEDEIWIAHQDLAEHGRADLVLGQEIFYFCQEFRRCLHYEASLRRIDRAEGMIETDGICCWARCAAVISTFNVSRMARATDMCNLASDDEIFFSSIRFQISNS